MARCTVCCHGTDNDSANNDHNGDVGGGLYHVTQRVYDTVMGAKLLFEGAGSQLYQETTGQWDTGGHGMLGITFGKGVEHNTKECVKELTKLHANVVTLDRIDLVGFSRGAVTCFKIAHALSQCPPLHNADVRIFAIDPVPGTLGAGNSHCYKAIKLMPNVKACKVIYAEHERREAFRPVLVHGVNATNHYEEDTMPGNHGGVVDTGATEEDNNLAARLVLSQAVQFLQKGGTQLPNNMTREPLPDLDRYGKIMNNLDLYKAMGTTKGGWGPNAGLGTQVVGKMLGGTSGNDRNMAAKRDPSTLSAKGMFKAAAHYVMGNAEKDKFDKQSMNARFQLLPRGRRFFCNNDHRDLLSTHFPVLAQYLGMIEIEGGRWGHNYPQLLDKLGVR